MDPAAIDLSNRYKRKLIVRAMALYKCQNSTTAPHEQQDELIRYDTKEKFNVNNVTLTWTQKLSDQLNLAHVDRKK